jgi:hypothetical protein
VKLLPDDLINRRHFGSDKFRNTVLRRDGRQGRTCEKFKMAELYDVAKLFAENGG